MIVTPWRATLALDVVALALELHLRELLRLAVGLAARRDRGLEVDRHHRAELAERVAVHRVEQERADDLVHVAVDLDAGEVHAHPRLGRRGERRREHRGVDLGVGEVRDLEAQRWPGTARRSSPSP